MGRLPSCGNRCDRAQCHPREVGEVVCQRVGKPHTKHIGRPRRDDAVGGRLQVRSGSFGKELLDVVHRGCGETPIQTPVAPALGDRLQPAGTVGKALASTQLLAEGPTEVLVTAEPRSRAPSRTKVLGLTSAASATSRMEPIPISVGLSTDILRRFTQLRAHVA